MTVTRLYGNKLIQLHLLGASGPDVQRPFKVEENPLAKMLKDASANAADGSADAANATTDKRNKKKKRQ